LVYATYGAAGSRALSKQNQNQSPFKTKNQNQRLFRKLSTAPIQTTETASSPSASRGF
jgi:hypothetical protein